MRVDLSSQLPGAGEASGSFVGPDGLPCTRDRLRLSIRDLDDLVASRAEFPVVLEKAAERRLEWNDGEEAALVWRSVRRYASTREPSASMLAERERWLVQLWRSGGGQLVIYLVGRP